MEILYQDKRILLAVKPWGVVSTAEPGGMPDLLRAELGDPTACVRTVHRLDQAVGGLMVFARSREAERRLSAQMAQRQFHKEYLAVVHGHPAAQGSFHDLLWRDPRRKMTLVTDRMDKNVKEALLDYRTLAAAGALSLVSVRLHTGRTHQIRAQFAHHGFPLAGDRKYGLPEDDFPHIALWSHRLRFCHPETGAPMDFTAPPPEIAPWTLFSDLPLTTAEK